jgi:hypothetical protein
MYSASHLETTSARLALFKGFSISGGFSFLYFSQYWMIFLRVADLTLGKGISSSVPVSIWKRQALGLFEMHQFYHQ